MNGLWFFFASLTVIGGLMYNVSTKLGSATTDVLGFMFTMEIVATVLLGLCCLAARYGYNVDVTRGLNASTIKYAVIAGVGAAIINVGFFLALRTGSAISTQVFWSIGGLVAFAAIAVLFLGETLTLTKTLGLAFGIISVLLITKAP